MPMHLDIVHAHHLWGTVFILKSDFFSIFQEGNVFCTIANLPYSPPVNTGIIFNYQLSSHVFNALTKLSAKEVALVHRHTLCNCMLTLRALGLDYFRLRH